MTSRLSANSRDLIERQCGVLARWQAAASGPAELAAVDALLRRGRWQVIYHGVYGGYTGRSERESTLWAACLRGGLGAVLSHVTAAELDGLADRRNDLVHVTIPATRRVRVGASEFGSGQPRLVIHRSARLDAARHPVRVPPRTRIEETVLDLVEQAMSREAVFWWLAAACGRRLTTAGQIRAATLRRAKMRWRADVVLALADIADGALSGLERRFLRDVERPHGLPRAKRQALALRGGGRSYLDNLYEEYGVAVELDGRAAHPDEDRWRDIHRDNYFAGTGIITLRYNWADVVGHPCLVAAQIGRVLRLQGWAGTLGACGPSCVARVESASS